MDAQGKIESITKPIKGSGYLVTVRIDALPEGLEDKLLDVSMKVHREKRSKDANALLWACIGDIARVLKVEPWSVYLMLLKRYGKYTYIVVKPDAVEKTRQMWRETEVVGDIDIHGTKGVQMLCYFGSSTYDTKEMSDILEGTLMEMDEMHIQKPASSDLRRALEEWERNHNG
jgi:hypothetical protein